MAGGDALGAYFGFTATLPVDANGISIDVLYNGDIRHNVLLTAYDINGTSVGQQSGPISAPPGAFMLAIDSNQYNITNFKLSVGAGGAGYDNISYTYLPEPSALTGMIGILIFGGRRR